LPGTLDFPIPLFEPHNEGLRQPLNPDWLMPILMCRRHDHREWLGSLNMVRVRGSEQAAPVLLSCVDFGVPWSHRNFWILHNAKYAREPAEFDYIHDPNTRSERVSETTRLSRHASCRFPVTGQP
jgi:hypothetical protein